MLGRDRPVSGDRDSRHAAAPEHDGRPVSEMGRAIHDQQVVGGKQFPDPDRVVVIIWGRNRIGFTNPPEKYYMGKSVCITGLIEEYEGVPWINLESRLNIKEQ